MYPVAEKRFLFFNKLTIISLFLVITAGGIVRSTGSGMGCPDWPTCFGMVIPPTNENQLPPGYEERHIEGRKAKNERFSRMLEALGYNDLASQIRNDPNILVHEEFNAAKTWTEFLNRLVGVITGFLLILSAFFSFAYFRSKRSIFILSVVNVFLVGFQGWLGSIVVSTNLMPWVITVHMMLALLIVAVSIYTYFKARSLRDRDLLINHSAGIVRWLAVFSLLLMIVQVIFGTDVREQIDIMSGTQPVPPRSEWIGLLGQVLDYHRILAYISALVVVVLYFLVRSRFAKRTHQSFYTAVVLVLVASQFATGYILYHFEMPPVMQTSHLVLASLLFGAQYYLVLLLGKVAR